MSEYPFTEIEKKWQKRWEEAGIFKAINNSDKPKYYVLSMFPYPSGALHMGHVSNYSISDAITRLRFTEGYNVLQPQGFDAFGMPAENFAIKNNSHPSITTESNIQIMLKQFKMLGVAVDWDRELSTHRPNYYHWGQWLFKRMYEKGLVYRKASYVNWCDECQTVLANEQVEDGKCWRCESTVRQKDLVQWFFKITEYAEELLDFSKVIDWPERVKTMQTNWIGKSIGTEVFFDLDCTNGVPPSPVTAISDRHNTNGVPPSPVTAISDRHNTNGVSPSPVTAISDRHNTNGVPPFNNKIITFTTRPDTLFGVTFLALPPEHPLITQWLKNGELSPEIADFCQKVMNDDKINRSALDTTKEGVFTGKYCINPANGEKVQIWITNYVLMDYGTGAVMGVPAHDQRDYDFAKKYNIPIKTVIVAEISDFSPIDTSSAYTAPGILINSAQFTNMNSEDSKQHITEWLTSIGKGRATTTYRLRDWGISRQRYWGAPIPIIHCDDCGIVLVPDENLPVELPKNVQVGKTTSNPLLSVPEWINVPCPKCNKPARRETDTMDTFVDSSWYYARYTDVNNDKLPFDKQIAEYWLPVDQYIGGIEHACMHLLYARYFHKFMRDIGLVNTDEPFARLLTQGMVTNEGAKMSKSKGNTVDPQEFIDRYGADTCRLFMLFASPPEKDVEWSKDGVIGAFRFLNRLWNFFNAQSVAAISDRHIDGETPSHPVAAISDRHIAGETPSRPVAAISDRHIDCETPSVQIKALRYSTHITIKKNLEDLQHRMQFNTNIASIMEHFNNVSAIKNISELSDIDKFYYQEAILTIPRLLYFYAPHLCEELWEMAGGKGFIHEQGLISYNPKFIIQDEIVYAVQVNGKIRGKLEISAEVNEDEIKKAALSIDNVSKTIDGKDIKKIIVVKGKLVSIVV